MFRRSTSRHDLPPEKHTATDAEVGILANVTRLFPERRTTTPSFLADTIVSDRTGKRKLSTIPADTYKSG